MSSFALTSAELHALFDQIPALTGQPRTLEDLSGGLTNRNIKVTTPDGVFVARCSDRNASALEIDRDAEHVNSRAAQAAGVGAPVIDYRPDLGVLVVGFLDGATLGNSDFQRPDVVQRAATSIRRLHAGPRFQGMFDMFERQQAYLATVLQAGYRLPAGYLDHAETFADIQRALAVRAEATLPCNNDLLAENFIDDGETIWLIDYEYAGNNDACFELGNLASECRLGQDQLENLVTAYYGRPRRDKIARAQLQSIVAQYGWTLWGCIQNAVSPMDYDFWAWATERYESAVEQMRGPDFAGLLHAVQHTT